MPVEVPPLWLFIESSSSKPGPKLLQPVMASVALAYQSIFSLLSSCLSLSFLTCLHLVVGDKLDKPLYFSKEIGSSERSLVIWHALVYTADHNSIIVLFTGRFENISHGLFASLPFYPDAVPCSSSPNRPVAESEIPESSSFALCISEKSVSWGKPGFGNPKSDCGSKVGVWFLFQCGLSWIDFKTPI